MQITHFDSLHSKKYNPADKEKWLELVREWEKSNEKQSAFCRRNNLDIKIFSYVKTKLLLKKAQNKFIPVSIQKEIPAPNIGTIILENNRGIKLYIPTSSTNEQLVNILKIVGWQC